MKKRVLLVDESLTVQKVVALTLDKNRFSIAYAKSRSEAMKMVAETLPELILVSDQVADIAVSSFPREVEALLARKHPSPEMVLITAQDIKEMRWYAAVLKKPFSPQALQSIVQRFSEDKPAPQPEPSSETAVSEDFEDQRLQRIFNDAFNDESSLVRETFRADAEANEEATLLNIPAPKRGQTPAAHEEKTVVGLWDEQAASTRASAPSRTGKEADLWEASQSHTLQSEETVMNSSDSVAYKAVLQNQVEERLEAENLQVVVDKVLAKILPPLVERLVQERLDKLLREHEELIEMKA